MLQLEEPPKLRATRQSDICERCEEEQAGGQETLQEHKELFRAARALLDNGIENEDEIIPTLVLAANVGQMSHLKHIRDELAKAGRERKARVELAGQLHSVSGGLMMSSGRVVDGVPLVQRAPFRISVTRDKGQPIEEIAFDVFKRSVTHNEVRKWYEWYLDREGVDYDLNDLSRGVVVYKGDNREFFRLIARPEEKSVDSDGRILPTTEGVRKFPHPQALAGLYHGLQGLIEFTDFPLLLAGRQSGPMLKPHNLVPACVGWYVADRGRHLEQRGALSQVTKILNEYLLAPRGEQPANSLARNIPKVEPAVLHFEHAIKGDMST